MNETLDEVLAYGIAAARSKSPSDRDRARFDLEWVLQRGYASAPQQIQAWLWLSQIEEDPIKRRACLENILKIEPDHPLAQQGLVFLDRYSRAKPTTTQSKSAVPLRPAIDHQPASLSQAHTSEVVRRYVCPQCGGRMAYEAAERQLTCESCGNHRFGQAAAQPKVLSVEEQDFLAALPTAKAQCWQLATMRAINCQGCGATFTLPPLDLTGECPFCGSPHVVETIASNDLIQPEGVLPFQFDVDTVLDHIHQWLKQQPARSPKRAQPVTTSRPITTSRPWGVYLPYWTFDLDGEIYWRDWARRTINFLEQEHVWELHIHSIFYDDLLVPASYSSYPGLLREVADFDTHTLQPYSSDFLADWPAEVYQVSLAAASLAARQRAVAEARQHVTRRVNPLDDLGFDTSHVKVLSYKLVLLPVWLSSYEQNGQRYPIMVNGQTGKVSGEVPLSGFQKFMIKALEGI